MDTIKKLTTAQLEKWLGNEEEEFGIEQFRRKYNIDADCDLLYKAFERWVKAGILKRLRRGWYHKVTPIEPIKWWNGTEGKVIDLVWPYGVDDNSSFGFDENIEICSGDIIVIAGLKNMGKTTMAYNFLVNNLDKFPQCRLMVNEYKPYQFRKRIGRLNWVDIWNGDGTPKFELLPVYERHEDYILPNALNIIDWIHIRENLWEIASKVEDIQKPLRDGIAIIFTQKSHGKPFGVGGDWGSFFASVYMTIDNERLTVMYVKSSKSYIQNKTYGFRIIGGGSKFHDIREVKTCPTCKGHKYIFDKECTNCRGLGYVELDG